MDNQDLNLVIVRFIEIQKDDPIRVEKLANMLREAILYKSDELVKQMKDEIAAYDNRPKQPSPQNLKE